MPPFDTDKLLDDVGRRILLLLQENARLSFSEIGRQVGLTQPAVAERVRRMEENGIITGYHAAVNPEKMGRGVNVFIHVTAHDGRYERIEAFARKQPDITECYCIAGKVDVLIKASFESLAQLKAMVDELAQFGSVESSVILEAYVSRRALE
ncbi:MAG: Lrp/AsnC family transcriptional regulator [Chloroflexi bacterium]|nr:Lrp/AsnC family transcriptional regulator [Chloroflexota bacterium]